MDKSNEYYIPPNPTVIETLDDSSSFEISDLVLQGTFILLNYLLSDPLLADWFDCIRKGNDLRYKETQADKNKGKPHHRLGSDQYSLDYVVSSENASIAPPALEILQLPLFDTIRLIFYRIESITNIQTYFLIIKIWLLYTQPWKALDPYSTNKNSNVFESSRKFDPSLWGAYVSANFHYYTILLVMFFESVSKLDLSLLELKDLDTFRHLFYEVIDLFSREGKLMKNITELLDKYKLFASRNFATPLYKTNDKYVKAGGPSNGLGGCLLDEEFLVNPTLQFDLFSIYRQHLILFPDDYSLSDSYEYKKS